MDVAPSSPLLIGVRGPEVVLDHKVLYCSSPHSKVRTELRDGSIVICFDYLDPKQGVIFEILHTGGFGSISFSGSIIGGGEVKSQENPGDKYGFVSAIAYLLIIGVISVVLFAGIFYSGLSGLIALVMSLVAFCLAVWLVAKLFGLWHGRFMVEKLSNGYAKQEKAGASSSDRD